MSTALEELKLLLLQENWDENKEAMVDALQLLLGVAEMKTRSVSRMALMDPENHLTCSTDSIFSDFNSSLDRVTFDERSEDECSADKKTTESYYTADENYDVSVEFLLVEFENIIALVSLGRRGIFFNESRHGMFTIIQIELTSSDFWFSPHQRAHLQACGRDSDGFVKEMRRETGSVATVHANFTCPETHLHEKLPWWT